MKLLIHSKTSNGAAIEVWKWISNFFPHFVGMWLLIHAGIKDNTC